MGKLIVRFLAYFLVFMLLSAILPATVTGDAWGFLLLAGILVLANLFIRPLLTLLALPFNLLTFGIASVFVNMLTLLTADAIVAPALLQGFWTLALASVLIMAVDACIRTARMAVRS